jgi:hypothetical protein
MVFSWCCFLLTVGTPNREDIAQKAELAKFPALKSRTETLKSECWVGPEHSVGARFRMVGQRLGPALLSERSTSYPTVDAAPITPMTHLNDRPH